MSVNDVILCTVCAIQKNVMDGAGTGFDQCRMVRMVAASLFLDDVLEIAEKVACGSGEDGEGVDCAV